MKVIFNSSLEESSNYRWQADTSIEFPIWKYLSITMSYLYTYENIVIDKQKPEDRILSIGLKIKSWVETIHRWVKIYGKKTCIKRRPGQT